MDFSHYTDEPVQLAIDLVNTDQRPVDGPDELADTDALTAFLADRAHLWDGAMPAPRDDDLPAIHQLRERLRRVLAADDVDTATAELNAILSDHVATPRISTHGNDPHLHFEPLDATLPQWLAVVTGMGLATVVVEHGIDRFGCCSADDCLDYYVDTTRNRSRRHCSSTCSTRSHVAAYRRRQRSNH